MKPLALGTLALAATACAAAGEALAPPPSPFRDVRSLALVRAVDERSQRPKDPLDGLEETLRARGFSVRVIELGRERPPELADVERLFGQLELRAASGRQERLARPVVALGHEAAAPLERLGVDAIASYHRLDRRRFEPLPPSTAPGTLFPAPAPAMPAGPMGALVLVNREGRVAVFGWGDAGAFDDPAVPLNAAEAIDHLVRALTGELPDE
jgi:hypothetical protein